MEFPEYWLRSPVASDAIDPAEFDALLERAILAGPESEIEYSLPAPKWQFLQHVIERGDILLHGSSNPEIRMFEPRKARDVREFGDRAAVYAASDGIWPLFFAVLDRSEKPFIVNAAIRVMSAPEQSLWFFSVTDFLLASSPWRDGSIYFLPRDGFDDDELMDVGGVQIRSLQAANPRPVRPLARLAVTPTDFPLLDQVRGHDDAIVAERAAADPAGFPWVD
jgi:hypothetical protein